WTFAIPPVQISGAHPTLLPGTWLVLQIAGKVPTLHNITAVNLVSASAYALSGDVTEVEINPASDFPTNAEYRRTRVLAGSKQFTLGEAPLATYVFGGD